MPALSFRLFDAASDAEAARYRILAGLAETRAAFRSNRISPWLGDLVAVHRVVVVRAPVVVTAA